VSTTNPQSDTLHDAPARGARALRFRRAADGTPSGRARARSWSKSRRRLANVAGLMAGLVLTGALYSTFAPANAADDTATSASSAEAVGPATATTCRASRIAARR
jgi:ubiquinol-cytochrome c reductase cytochrome c subunit